MWVDGVAMEGLVMIFPAPTFFTVVFSFNSFFLLCKNERHYRYVPVIRL